MKPISFALLILAGLCTTMPPFAAAQSGTEPTRPATAEERGRLIFKQRCRICHDEYTTGARVLALKIDGLFQKQKLFDGKPVNDENVMEVIKMGPTPGMPGFRYTLSDQEIRDLVAFLKTK